MRLLFLCVACVAPILTALPAAADPASALADSYTSAPSQYVWRAHGSEPEWSLWMSKRRIRLDTSHGGLVVQSALPDPVTHDKGAVYELELYALAEPLIRVRIDQEICRDPMANVVYPYRADLEIDGEILPGCGGLPVHLLAGAEWVMESIADEPVIAGSQITLVFNSQERVAGVGGCNNYAGKLLIGEAVSISDVASTKKACAPALMEQEKRFLATLADVHGFDFDADGLLLLSANDGSVIRARRTRRRR